VNTSEMADDTCLRPREPMFGSGESGKFLKTNAIVVASVGLLS
jgi:hypothetical protein